jgi:uncharacterized protein YigE (DUF2233 family)
MSLAMLNNFFNIPAGIFFHNANSIQIVAFHHHFDSPDFSIAHSTPILCAVRAVKAKPRPETPGILSIIFLWLYTGQSVMG